MKNNCKEARTVVNAELPTTIIYKEVHLKTFIMNKKSKSTLEKLKNKLRFQNYAETTISTYLNYAEMFLLHNVVFSLNYLQPKTE